MFIQYFVLSKSVENNKVYKNEFTKIFNKGNVINLKKNILNYCKQENIPLNIKESDDEILEILSIFTNEQFKKQFTLSERLEINEVIIIIIHSSLMFMNNNGLGNKLSNLHERFMTWLCSRPSIYVQKSTQYIAEMIEFILKQSNNFQNADEFELCYLSMLKYFTQISLNYGDTSIGEAYYQTKEENFHYYINYLFKNKTIDKLGKYYFSLQNRTAKNYTAYQFIPMFCKNLLFPSDNYFEFLKKYDKSLFDTKHNTLLPFGMVMRWAFYNEKTKDIYLFEFLKRQYYNKYYINISKDKKGNFNMFLKCIEDLFEENE